MSKIYAIEYCDAFSDMEPSYVKMYSITDGRGKTTWHFKAVDNYSKASKWATEVQAKRAIKGIPAFNGRGSGDSLTAIVVTHETASII